jgi:hypothetical protein
VAQGADAGNALFCLLYAVFVAHSLKRGEFVAQIPFIPVHQLSTDNDVLLAEREQSDFDPYMHKPKIKTGGRIPHF